jgi:hypothetical protein
MTQGEEPDGTPAAPEAPDERASDPAQEAGPTPTDDAAAPPNADLNAGALSQPTDGAEP